MSVVDVNLTKSLVQRARESKAVPGQVVNPDPVFRTKFVWLYKLFVPFMYVIGAYAAIKRGLCKLLLKRDARTNVWLVDGVSPSSRRVRDGAATYKALEVVYNHTGGVGSNQLVRFIDHAWLHVRNAQAVYNRLQIVRAQVFEAIQRQSIGKENPNDPVRILSIAAGSAQGVIEAVSMALSVGYVVEVLLLDHSQEALDEARRLAEKHDLPPGTVKTVRRSVVNRRGEKVFDFEEFLEGFRPDIVEMAGLIDYLKDAAIKRIFQKIFRLLPRGGTFITCHIHPNHESFFLLYVVNWWMLYRTRKQLEDLLTEGWFPMPCLMTEPLKIHTVAVATRM